MKKLFRGYYGLTKREFARLWERALLVMDANVLLNIYDYSDATRRSFLDLLGKLGDRLWLPHQVGLEYHRNRLNKIGDAIQKYDASLKRTAELRTIHKDFESQKAHPFIADKTLKKLDKLIAQLRRELEKKKQTVQGLFDRDHILLAISKLYGRRVGPAFDEEQLSGVYSEAEKRFKNLIPPGFEDDRKSGTRRYGDVVLWFQILDMARTEKADIIFVTAEKKGDWWQLVKNAVRGPRLELLHEFRRTTKRLFYMYEPVEFMKLARKHLKQKIDDAAIDEVESAGGVVHQATGRGKPTSWLLKALARDVSTLHDVQSKLDVMKLPSFMTEFTEPISDIGRSLREASGVQRWGSAIEDMRRAIVQNPELGELLRSMSLEGGVESAKPDAKSASDQEAGDSAGEESGSE